MNCKDTNFFHGQPLLNKLVSLIDSSRVAKISKKNKGDHYTKRFTTYQHLILMLYGVIADCNSLREISAGILSYGEKIHHCGLDYAVPKSTLADANKRRNVNIFEGIYQDLVETYRNTLSDSVKEVLLPKNLFAIDSTTISLFKPIFECVGRHPISGKPKGGIKSYQKLDLNMGVPIQIKHTHAKQHDSIFIHQDGILEKDDIGIFDKAYIDYELFDRFTQKSIFFVTRLKENAKEEILKDNEILDATPQEVLRDCQIKLKYKKEHVEHEVELRIMILKKKNVSIF